MYMCVCIRDGTNLIQYGYTAHNTESLRVRYVFPICMHYTKAVQLHLHVIVVENLEMRIGTMARDCLCGVLVELCKGSAQGRTKCKGTDNQ